MSVNPQNLVQIGRYPVRRFIAQGGMAWVFEVVDPKFDAPRALKMLKPGVAAGDQFRRFEDEARILGRLDHPNLITIFDFGIDEATSCHFYTMTLVDTPPLSKRGVLSSEAAAPIFLDVLAGLSRLHDAGVVHRDIKPANILIHPDGRAMLADLGIARTADVSEGETWATSSAGSHGTKTGLAIGTPDFMSPEQARALRGIGRSSDVFSFGLTMYNTLTGHTVYDDVAAVDSSNKHEILAYLGHLSFSRSEFEFHFASDTPEAIQDVIRTACRVVPEERYQNASEMLAALRGALVARERAPSRARSASDLTPWLGVSIAAALLVALGLGGRYWWTHRAPPVDATASLEAVSQLDQQATRVLEVARSADPPAAGDVLSAAQEKQATAGSLLQLGAKKQAKGDLDAHVFLENARDGLQEGCAVLLNGDLADRFGTAADEVQRAAEGLRRLNVKELAPDAWAEVEQRLAALTPPDPTLAKCDLAGGYQAKLDDVRKARVGAEALEQQLKAQWPKLAANARADALTEQVAAKATNIESPEFRSVIDRAAESLQSGDAAVERSSYREARDSYSDASRDFTKALVIAQAWRAQQSVRSLHPEGAADPEVDRELKRADQLYDAGQFREAEEVYRREAKFIEAAIAKETKSKGALLAKRAADEARETALANGAGSSARADLARADTLQSAAASAFEQDNFGAAEKAYGEAAQAFELASAAAKGGIDDARELGRRVHQSAEQLGSCTALDERVARPLCASGLEALALGDAAVQAEDAPAAREKYGTASDSLVGARKAQDAYVKGLNVAPTIDSRKPAASQQVEIHPRESLHFAIGATDKNGDALKYKWTVDGRERPETGQSLDLSPTSDSDVQVSVDDNRGGVASTSWKVAVVNRNPKLLLSPSSDVTLDVDASQTFKAQVSDPDGEEVKVAMLLDGEPVANGNSFTFGAHAPGTHVLEVRASDPSGGISSVKRNISVVTPNHAPLLSLAPQQESLKLRAGERVSFKAKASDPDGDGVKVAFLLDGTVVARADSYTFVADRAGSYALQATATDSRGSASSVQRRIQVESPATPAPSLAPQEPAPAPATKVAPPRPDANQIAKETLDKYRAAYESRDIDRLAEVWEMDANQRKSMGSFFDSMKRISMSLEKPEVQEVGGQLSVRFIQTVEADGISPVRVVLVATLVKSGSGWKIQKLGPDAKR